LYALSWPSQGKRKRERKRGGTDNGIKFLKEKKKKRERAASFSKEKKGWSEGKKGRPWALHSL